MMLIRYISQIGKYFIMWREIFKKPTKWSVMKVLIYKEIDDLIIGSLGIVAFISFFVGGVVAIQTALNLTNPLIPKYLIGFATRQSVILEFAPTFLCIVLAGVVGSKIASELGNMRVSEQIDALEIMGINTKNYLILPKILGAITTVPMLVGISAVTGIWGGYLVGSWTSVVPAEVFITGIRKDFVVYYINISFYKSFIFAIIISTVPSFYGYYVKGGALEIGKSGTKSVVVSCILILIADYIIAAIAL